MSHRYPRAQETSNKPFQVLHCPSISCFKVPSSSNNFHLTLTSLSVSTRVSRWARSWCPRAPPVWPRASCRGRSRTGDPSSAWTPGWPSAGRGGRSPRRPGHRGPGHGSVEVRWEVSRAGNEPSRSLKFYNHRQRRHYAKRAIPTVIRWENGSKMHR